MDLEEFLSDSNYLPKNLRDFHVQKDLFKRVHELLRNESEHSELKDLNWVMAHIYTIDKFLWFMAAHGYTLQRSRQRVDFCDLDATMEEFRKRRAEHFKTLFAAELKKNRVQEESEKT